MSIFQQTPSSVFLGEVWRSSNNRNDKREEDHGLYFNLETFEFTVVEEVENVSGPNVSCSHIARSVGEYLHQHPERGELIRALLPVELRR